MRIARWPRAAAASPRPDATGRRVVTLRAAFFLCAGALVVRLVDLQVVRAGYFSSLAAKVQDTSRSLAAERGSIYVRDGAKLFPLVTNRDYYLIYADPRRVTDPGQVVDTLARVFRLTPDEWRPLAGKLARRRDPYQPLRRKATRAERDEILAARLEGIFATPETYRWYPEPGIGGQVLGFVGFAADQRVGRYGLEGYFQPLLAGQSGRLRSVADAHGRALTIGAREIEPPKNGDSLVLTIDRTVQLAACDQLEQGIAAFAAAGGTVVVLTPETGAILAMCSRPNFNPEDYAGVSDFSVYNNPAIFTPYEPGSVFKPITMAAAIDRGALSPSDTYEDSGEVSLASGQRIRNSDLKAHGVQTMVQVLERSLNTGAVFAVTRVGKAAFRQYVRDFGFGALTGVTLDTEVPGDVSALDRRGEIYAMTASFGQGITATPLQLALAFGALANGGKLMRPMVVQERLPGDGGPAAATNPQVVRQVVTARTASTVSGMLVQAVEGVYDHKAKVAGFYVAGKTGTAQIAAPGGGYGADVNHTFIGYFPAQRPVFVVLVKLDRPTKVKHAADSTTVVFRQLAEFLIDYYQIPPERP